MFRQLFTLLIFSIVIGWSNTFSLAHVYLNRKWGVQGLKELGFLLYCLWHKHAQFLCSAKLTTLEGKDTTWKYTLLPLGKQNIATFPVSKGSIKEAEAKFKKQMYIPFPRKWVGNHQCVFGSNPAMNIAANVAQKGTYDPSHSIHIGCQLLCWAQQTSPNFSGPCNRVPNPEGNSESAIFFFILTHALCSHLLTLYSLCSQSVIKL